MIPGRCYAYLLLSWKLWLLEFVTPGLRFLFLRYCGSLWAWELEIDISIFSSVAICYGTLGGMWKLWVMIWTEEPGDTTITLPFVCKIYWLSTIWENIIGKLPLTVFSWVVPVRPVSNFSISMLESYSFWGEKMVLQSLAFETTFTYLDGQFISVIRKGVEWWWKYWCKISWAFESREMLVHPCFILWRISCLVCIKYCWLTGMVKSLWERYEVFHTYVFLFLYALINFK